MNRSTSISTSPVAPEGRPALARWAPLRRWHRRLLARLQRHAQPLFLTVDGLNGLDGQVPSRPQDWAHIQPGHQTQRLAGPAVQLLISAQLLHELVCEPGLPLADEASLQAYGRQQFAHYFGAAAKHWPLATWRLEALGEGALEQCGLSALQGVDWPALRQYFDTHDMHLRAAQPAWAAVLRHLWGAEPEWARAPHAALAWVEGHVLTWLQLREGRLLALRQLRLRSATLAALHETVAELCQRDDTPQSVRILGYGLNAEDTAAASDVLHPLPHNLRLLADLSGTAPLPQWFAPLSRVEMQVLPAPDFLGPRRHHAALAWGLAITASLVLGVSSWGLWQSHQDQTLAAEQVQALSAELAHLRAAQVGPSAQPSRPISSQSAATAAQTWRAAMEVQQLLQQPWEALLSNVEQAGLMTPPPAAINWLALDYTAARGDLRLEGLAPDKLLPLQMTDRLNAAPGWHAVMLSRFQTAEQGLSGQRFEITAKVQAQRLQRTGFAADSSGGAKP
ncbi:hypothetical protein [Roseateles koreensis]|uniref:Uncharacterized protein n=1 Tax=Roseateles koreensis TaxID=2987526 RepID=A0ABT5KS01_9BURK|nr:hypothetical protein [Roseateles koreensis]MDC8785700.1 hypothetical protein [Roseateles koreensis]